MDGEMDGHVDGWMNEWVDERMALDWQMIQAETT